MNIHQNTEKNKIIEKQKIIEKFKEIKYQDGLILIEHIINNKYDEHFIKMIILSLLRNNNKYIYEIYDYIIKNTHINYDTIIDSSPIIYDCAIFKNISLSNYLIKKGININLISNEKSPLMLASQYSNKTSSIKNKKYIELLLENGANINLQNIYGHSALMLASKFSNYFSSIETVKLLLDNGADPNLKNKDGNTVLIIVLKNINLSNQFYRSSSIDIVKLLLEYGADPNIKNKEGKSAYDFVETEEQIDLIKPYMN